MAKLNAAARKALPASTFAGPDRSFPIPDKGHAKAALGLLHNAPASAQPKIRAKAEAVLHKADGGMVEGVGSKTGYAGGGYVHNPDNRLPKKALHTRGRNRGM